MSTMTNAMCPYCGERYSTYAGAHRCPASRTAQGFAAYVPDQIDYDRIRRIVREEIAAALARVEAEKDGKRE